MQVLEKTETTVFYPNTEQYEIQIVPIDKRYKIGNVEKGIKQVDEKILRYCEEIEDPEMLGVNCLEINSSYKNGRSVLFSGDQVGNIVAWTPENQEIEKARGEVEKDDEWTSD
ncbi:hypothetical protein AX774_g241 [Zancudomyces culisetae]|uniref:Uncharacterized protein n=1 Tax=Zancudomyces culisetae TaxID=1213189 RepID=A0A1R1PZ46_ZANCU|nr:hypothetical protein AX774_g241 [Zancudomyces culisetae]|eukprot:OMH86214.1 hypothetical protein AX774_g241 [Zancudomyces culisetae]